MIKLLVDNPLLLLFVIAAISYPLGRVKIKGTSLGVAMVLKRDVVRGIDLLFKAVSVERMSILSSCPRSSWTFLSSEGPADTTTAGFRGMARANAATPGEASAAGSQNAHDRAKARK